jgi:hypothetical protein
MSLAGQAIRMMRTKWRDNADLLAQELYEIFLTDKDPETGPLTVNFSPNQPPQITPPNFVLGPLNLPQLPDLALPDFNFNNPNDLQQQDLPQDQTPDPNNPVPAKPKKRTKSSIAYQRTAMPAQVISGGGSSYVVNAYPNGTGDDPKQMTVNQLQQNIPDLNPGDWLPVFQVIKFELKVTEIVENPGQNNERVISTSTEMTVLSTTNDAIAGSTVGGTGGNAFPGFVISGSGNKYLCRIYPDGFSTTTTKDVLVTQMQIDPTETIPTGTFAIVLLGKDKKYTMQVPVWISDPVSLGP